MEASMEKITHKLFSPDDADIAAVDVEQWLQMYENMLRIRLFEEQVNDLYKTGKMPGLAHLYIGEEAIAVGVSETLRVDDYITSTHRGHGHCLAKGAAIDLMFAELLGKEAGYCRGKGGSMHIADPDSGNLGANAIVGAGSGIATGAALSIKLQDTDQVSVAFFGEGAMGQGLLYEVMNMASLWKLPVIYVCENNHYTEYTFHKEVMAGELRNRPAAFGIPVLHVNGQDVRAVFFAAQQLVEQARQGEGPGFLICDTYRYHGHHVGDINRGYYRSQDEEEDWKNNKDPLKLLSNWLIESREVPFSMFEEMEQQVGGEILHGVDFALNAAYPDPSEVYTNVYSG